MKNKVISIFIVSIILISSSHIVFAADTSWVNDAFSATGNFLNEPTEDTIGISPLFDMFKDIIKGANRTLIVLLAGISIIALSITGIKYILSGANPKKKEEAKQSLKTIFIGMAFGFGAFLIWKIAMAIVSLIISSF